MRRTRQVFGPWSRTALLLVAIVAGAGCITDRIDLVETGAIGAETRDSQRTRIAWVSAYRETDTVVVTGRVRIRGNYRGGGNGHVDITLVDSEGEIIDERPVPYSPRHLRRGHSASFTTRFEGGASVFALVRVVHHATWFHRSSGA